MINAQIIKGTIGYTYTIYIDTYERHTLNFNPILQYYNIPHGGNWKAYHFNKFIKVWGVLDGHTEKYTLDDTDNLVLPGNAKGILLPDTHLPNERIRAVMITGA